MAGVQVAKRELRSKINTVLSGLSAEAINRQSSTITKGLLSLPEYQAAKRLSIYLAMPSGEVQTAEIVRDAFKRGKQVFVPYIYRLSTAAPHERASIMEMLALHSIEDYESLQPDKWGIPSLDASTLATRENCLGGHGLLGRSPPPGEAKDSALDLIVVPGLGFDENFGRLGHGRGYYDHFIVKLRHGQGGAGRKPYLAALTLQEQLLPSSERVPVAEHDYPMDALVVGDGRTLKRA
ncbi:hypothetical protein LOZ53_004747 [Ophidiomyces ophidiicola]|nr:hypothetical protein LOZ55_001493 [Ophidiomyces ophidiicola]KAI1986057.1 hypothetical protein LOZ54_004005 [Ophidiomyces ophidiicola]KAI1986329.1 hypothetical protein LOZ53_004747 [Ophidiomyces ophidiicola]KAI2003438.1 hypothetical protein LOZ51_000518 [Ophidiomyces ophidiicola]